MQERGEYRGGDARGERRVDGTDSILVLTQRDGIPRRWQEMGMFIVFNNMKYISYRSRINNRVPYFSHTEKLFNVPHERE